MTPGQFSPSCPLRQEQIEEGLRRLGLSRGDAVEVHSSLSSLGWVVGGANTVIQALINVVGQQGALVMSVYRVSPAIPLTAQERARGITWKVRLLGDDPDAQTGMGAISDTFCRRPDVVRGSGPYPVCAWGRDAERHSQGYQYLLEVDGWALLIGVGIHRCSSMHQAEKGELPAEISRRFRIPDDIRKDYPEELWAIGYGSTPDDAWTKVWEAAQRRDLIHAGRIGKADCSLFRARAVVGIYERFLTTDPFGLYGLKPET